MSSRSRRRETYCSSDSPRAPGRAPDSASATWTITASTVCISTSPWCASIACATASDSLLRRANWPPTSACGPSISWLTALPMSCRSAARRAVFGEAPSSSAIIAARWGRTREVGALDRVREHVLAVAGAVLQPAEDADQLGVEALDVGVQRGLLTGFHDV